MATILPVVYPLTVGADLDYGFDWSDWLQDGETIDQSTWTLDPASGLTKHDESESEGITVVWLKEIVADATYRIENEIVTNSSPPRTEKRSFYVKGVPIR